MSEKKTIVIGPKKIVFIILLVLTLTSLLILSSLGLKIDPSTNLDGSSSIFEQKEDLLFDYEILRYHSRVNVSSNDRESFQDIGINADRTNLYLGRIPKGSSSKKTLNLTNKQEESYKIKFFVFGNISELIKIKESITIKPGQNVQYSVIADTYPETSLGMYSGEIDLVIIKPKNFIGKILQKVI